MKNNPVRVICVLEQRTPSGWTAEVIDLIGLKRKVTANTSPANCIIEEIKRRGLKNFRLRDKTDFARLDQKFSKAMPLYVQWNTTSKGERVMFDVRACDK
jgi:hypothetical protein